MTGQLDNVIGEKSLLNGHNYKEWKSLMRSVFQREDLWDLFDPEPAPEPSKPDEKGKEVEIGNPSDDRVRAATDLLKRRKGKAMAYLRLSVTTEIRPRIEDLEEPLAAWRYLQGAF
jgi:hypothetical protein